MEIVVPTNWDMQLHHIAVGIVADGCLMSTQLDAIAMKPRVMPALAASGVTAASPAAVRPVIAVRDGPLADVVCAGWAVL